MIAGLMIMLSSQAHADVFANLLVPKDPVHQVLLRFLEAKTPEDKLAYIRPYQSQKDALFETQSLLAGFSTLVKTQKFDKETLDMVAKPEEGMWIRVDAVAAKAQWGPYGPSATSKRYEGSWYIYFEQGEWRVDVDATLGRTVDWRAFAIQRPQGAHLARAVAYLRPNGRYTRDFPESKYLEVRFDDRVGDLQFYVERGSDIYDNIWQGLKSGDADRYLFFVKFPDKETFFKSEVEIVGSKRGWTLGSSSYGAKAQIELPPRKEKKPKAKQVEAGDPEE